MYLTQTLNHLSLSIPQPDEDPGLAWSRSSVELDDDGEAVVVRFEPNGGQSRAYMSLPLAEARWLAESITAVLAASEVSGG